MEKVYLITGATGFLGREVAKKKKVVGLRMPGDKLTDIALWLR